MRTNQKHNCWACGKPTDDFIKRRKNVYLVKTFECNPKCFQAFDLVRIEQSILRYVLQEAPWCKKDFLTPSKNRPVRVQE